MKAFLSHSSKDKLLVEQVGSYLGTALCEYDEYSFEYVLNSQAIRKALHRSSLFVFFLSENSVQSDFVAEEVRTAFDFRASGGVRKVMIISLDETSYKTLPDWLQAINLSAKITNPKTIGRQIEAELLALHADGEKTTEIYIPRENEEGTLRRLLSRPPGEAPVAVHAVGFVGLGRKTFLKHTLSSIFPRQIRSYVVISLAKFEGASEFYRRVHEYFIACSKAERIQAFIEFQALDEERKVEELADLVTLTVSNEELIIVDDQGGVLDDDGAYQGYLGGLIVRLLGSPRPVVVFAQTRLMPLAKRERFKASMHVQLPPLDLEKTQELVSFHLRHEGISFDGKQLAAFVELMDGNPSNVRLAMSSVKSYGLDLFLADPTLLVEWKRQRAEDFLSQIQFSPLEIEIIAILVEYRLVSLIVLRACLTVGIMEMASSLRKLEDYCCIERRDELYTISLPIRDAFSRDTRFRQDNAWKTRIASTIMDVLDSYESDETAGINLIETAIKASLRNGSKTSHMSNLILPSYYIHLAWEAYRDDRRAPAIALCKEALALESLLTTDGKIEALRIWGLAAVRLQEKDEIRAALDALNSLNTHRAAKLHAFFIKGFDARIRKKFGPAEDFFLQAHQLARKNFHINRELADLYRKQGEFIEAESYARAAFKVAPTNPYIIDVMLEVLLGKSFLRLPVDQQEISSLFADLEHYGDVPGSSFFQMRRAQEFLANKDKGGALLAVNAAVQRTEEFLPALCLRAEIYIMMGDIKNARKDLKRLDEILTKKGGFSPDDEAKVLELDIKAMIEEERFKEARDKITKSQFLPPRVAKRLAGDLARMITVAPNRADRESQKWAADLINRNR